MGEPLPPLRLAAVTSSLSQLYSLQTSADATVGQAARFVHAQASTQPATTLELAIPLPSTMTLLERAAAEGDRLLIQLSPPRPAAWQPSVADQPAVHIQCGALSQVVHGQGTVTVGRAAAGTTPAVDLSASGTVAPELIPERCFELRYDAAEAAWYAVRVASARLRIDEFELPAHQPVRLAAQTQILLMPPAGSFLPLDRPLTRVDVRVQAQRLEEADTLPAGALPLRVLLGTELACGVLETTGMMTAEEIARHVLAFRRQPMPTRLRCYLLRVLPPATPLGQALASQEALLYAAHDHTTVRSVLTLRAADDAAVYALVGGPAPQTFMLGTRLPNNPTDAPDIDLYDLLETPLLPSLLPHLGFAWAQFHYDPDANAWSIRSAPHLMPVFFDGRRLTAAPARVLPGRILSIGIEGTPLVLRFVTELSNR